MKITRQSYKDLRACMNNSRINKPVIYHDYKNNKSMVVINNGERMFNFIVGQILEPLKVKEYSKFYIRDMSVTTVQWLGQDVNYYWIPQTIKDYKALKVKDKSAYTIYAPNPADDDYMRVGINNFILHTVLNFILADTGATEYEIGLDKRRENSTFAMIRVNGIIKGAVWVEYLDNVALGRLYISTYWHKGQIACVAEGPYVKHMNDVRKRDSSTELLAEILQYPDSIKVMVYIDKFLIRNSDDLAKAAVQFLEKTEILWKPTYKSKMNKKDFDENGDWIPFSHGIRNIFPKTVMDRLSDFTDYKKEN